MDAFPTTVLRHSSACSGESIHFKQLAFNKFTRQRSSTKWGTESGQKEINSNLAVKSKLSPPFTFMLDEPLLRGLHQHVDALDEPPLLAKDLEQVPHVDQLQGGERKVVALRI